jgi:predicted PurR-regulated permease PerM
MDAESERIELHVPFVTILKIALSLLLFAAIVKLLPVLITLVVAVLLAVMLLPVVDWLVARGARRGMAVAAIGFVLVALLMAFFTVIVPDTGAQLSQFMKNLPAIQAKVTRALPAQSPFIRIAAARLVDFQKSVDAQSWMRRGLTVGMYAVEAITAVVLVLVLVLYSLLEGRAFYAWLVSYVPRRYRKRVAETADESSKVVMAFMRGQVITSALCGVWVYAMLMLLHVPAALPLAVVAAIADIIPVVGTIIMTLPGVLVAFAVSPGAAFGALIGYLLYHLIENYVVIPRVYGKQMRLSTIGVLLSVTIGGSLLGVAGAVLALPFVAAYPIIERLWLASYLAPETIEDHAALHDENADSETTDEVLGTSTEEGQQH